MACPPGEAADAVCPPDEAGDTPCSPGEDALMPSGAAGSGADTVAAAFTDTVAAVTGITEEMTATIAASGATALARGLVRSGSAHSR